MAHQGQISLYLSARPNGSVLQIGVWESFHPTRYHKDDGSAFVGCQLLEIRTKSEHFKVEVTLLTMADETKIVKCIGREREIVVSKKVEVLGKSCTHIEKVVVCVDYLCMSDSVAFITGLFEAVRGRGPLLQFGREIV
jgi:hypothetical protein